MATSIIPEIVNKIQAILENSSKVKEIFAYPAEKFTKYPAVVYYPASIDNAFETNRENFKNYNFKMWVIINTEATTVQNGYQVMARVLDDVLAELDSGWDFETIGGHRVWSEVQVGNWGVSETKAGVEIAVEIDFIIKLLTNN